ncbi:uncharacterized protein LOC124194967 [Daphnia pulex]|uniref:uncharacterized protein LOC124194967 n=1 Tax=Daphnia pulex TaxID=6669 RepID=UPI001EDE0703|nr:uncharacterized protein LOC124194967 [Daphnia pulex]
MGNKNSVCTETAASPCESLELLSTLQCLPKGINNLERKTKEIHLERERIVKKLRDMADYLEKTHSDVLIADRVGTGVGIGSGLLFIGGLVAAPFTAGVSLALTTAATATGIMGAITSAGANITGLVMTKNSLAPLQEKLDKHLKHIKDISSIDPQYLVRATRLRPTLEILEKLSENTFLQLLLTFKKLITHALNGDYAQISRAVNHVVDPKIKELLQKLPIPLDRPSLQALAEMCTLIISHIRSIKQAIGACLNFLNKPELIRLAMVYTNSTAKSITATTQEVAQIKAAFKGTPMAMTKTVRYVAGVATTAFVVLDVIYMVRICKETGETPTVQNLRKMADDLEKEFSDETKEELAERDETDADE